MSIPHRLSATAVENKPAPAESTNTSAELDTRPLTDADALAVRVIARYNVERRQSGEAPLDLKGIGLLRQILADTIGRYQAQNGADEAH